MEAAAPPRVSSPTTAKAVEGISQNENIPLRLIAETVIDTC
jgi:hypothetical protein